MRTRDASKWMRWISFMFVVVSEWQFNQRSVFARRLPLTGDIRPDIAGSKGKPEHLTPTTTFEYQQQYPQQQLRQHPNQPRLQQAQQEQHQLQQQQNQEQALQRKYQLQEQQQNKLSQLQQKQQELHQRHQQQRLQQQDQQQQQEQQHLQQQDQQQQQEQQQEQHLQQQDQQQQQEQQHLQQQYQQQQQEQQQQQQQQKQQKQEIQNERQQQQQEQQQKQQQQEQQKQEIQKERRQPQPITTSSLLQPPLRISSRPVEKRKINATAHMPIGLHTKLIDTPVNNGSNSPSKPLNKTKEQDAGLTHDSNGSYGEFQDHDNDHDEIGKENNNNKTFHDRGNEKDAIVILSRKQFSKREELKDEILRLIVSLLRGNDSMESFSLDSGVNASAHSYEEMNNLSGNVVKDNDRGDNNTNGGVVIYSNGNSRKRSSVRIGHNTQMNNIVEDKYNDDNIKDNNINTKNHNVSIQNDDDDDYYENGINHFPVESDTNDNDNQNDNDKDNENDDIDDKNKTNNQTSTDQGELRSRSLNLNMDIVSTPYAWKERLSKLTIAQMMQVFTKLKQYFTANKNATREDGKMVIEHIINISFIKRQTNPSSSNPVKLSDICCQL